MAFELPKLNYAYDALEPHIDARTMEIHHSKHHNGYTTKLNAAIEGTALENESIESILEDLDMSNGASSEILSLYAYDILNFWFEFHKLMTVALRHWPRNNQWCSSVIN